MAVHGLINATLLYVDTINLTDPTVYHYTQFFEGAVGYMPLSIPCTRLMTVISFANPALPYDLTVYPVL